MGQMGFFDLGNRYSGLDAKNEPLLKIDGVVPWEDLRARLEAVWRRADKAGSTTLPSRGRAGSSVRSTAGCNACGCGRYAAGPSEPDLVGSDWSA